MIIPSIILYLAILGYTYFANNKRRSEISEQLQDLTLTVDSAAKSSLINAPFPLLILETDGNIVWRSSKFITEFANIDINNYISDLIIDIKSEIEKHKEQKFTLKNLDEIVSLLCCAFTNPDELPTIKGCATIYVKGVDEDTSKSKHINFSIASRNYTHCFKDGKFEIEIRDICIDNLQ